MKSVLVTGGSSMIGRPTVELLREKGYEVFDPTHEDCDLEDNFNAFELVRELRPTYCLHLAGFNGGILLNKECPDDIYYKTTQMGLNVLRACQEFEVQKIVSIISSCAYPNGEVLKEGTLWDGPPHPSVSCHAFAKRNLHAFSSQISKKGKTLAVCVVANNSFGPHDHFDDGGKVISGLIAKFVFAKRTSLPEVRCWGSGRPLRSFIFCDDLARLLVRSLEEFDDWETPLNLGTDFEISIKDLAERIKDATGYKGDIVWETNKPDGQYRKLLECGRMKEMFPDFVPTDFDEALRKTVSWYEENY